MVREICTQKSPRTIPHFCERRHIQHAHFVLKFGYCQVSVEVEVNHLEFDKLSSSSFSKVESSLLFYKALFVPLQTYMKEMIDQFDYLKGRKNEKKKQSW